MAKGKILVLGELAHSQKSFDDTLSPYGEIITPTAKNRAEFIEECKADRLDGVVAAFRTFASISITGRWDSELIEALPRSLKFVSHNGAGYDQIDVHACSARSPPILVSNTPTAVDAATADTAIFLILGALRQYNGGILALRKGEWQGNPPPPLGHDPEGKVLGILGMGGIGRNLKPKAEALGMTVIYHNRNKLDDAQAKGAEYVSFDDLLSRSDVLSLNLPLNKDTRHIISAAEFTKMKRGIVIVNTARGAVMDEAALAKALTDGHVASAGLDVYEEEPTVNPDLVKNPHCLLVPHMGTSTVETQTKMEDWCIANLRQALAEGTLKSPVPEQKELHAKETESKS